MWCMYGVMNTSHRQMVTLSTDRAEFLKQEAARLNISVSDLLRRIIDQYRAEKDREQKERQL
jgi:hypothetical protein